TGALIQAMNAWNLSAEGAAFAADVFTQAGMMGVGSLDEFAGAIGKVSVLASSAGIGLDELGASFSYVTNMGMSAKQAQRQFRYIISTLVNPSENLAGLFNYLGFESGQAMIAQYGLADSLLILREAIGDDQAFANMIGPAEAATVALALTGDAYADFVTEFGEGMRGITESARGVQLESIEMKMARLEAVSGSLQAKIGQDINRIKGVFVDMRFGFLSNVAAPIMRSPIGGAVSKIAAVTGMAAKGILDMGSTALNTAAQMTTLAANISNAGGIVKMFKAGAGLLGASFKMLTAPIKGVAVGFVGVGKSALASLPGIGLYTKSMWASVPATLAATWPILAIVAGVAALAAGVFLLVRNWGAVSGFFTGLWERIRGAFSAGVEWIRNLIFGASDWMLAAVAIFLPIIGIPALIIRHWEGIRSFFANLWNAPKAAIESFAEWIGGKVGAITAPFTAIGDAVGGVVSRIGGFFGSLAGGGRDSGAQLNDAFATGIDNNAEAPAVAFGDSLHGIARQMPHSDAPEGPLSELTSSGRALTETFASGMDEGVLREKAEIVFAAAIPQHDTIEFPAVENHGGNTTSQTFNIQNLYLQAEDCQTIFDFARMLIHSIERPQEAL
ncbi:MAG: phage tail tape measure protein, partial [Treponema sp.]|nr:phage tail tape measure protein [Treponema sp.]